MPGEALSIRSGLIDVSLDREVAVVTMNRPEKLNALRPDMRRDLAATLRHFGNGSRARGIVLTGAGRAFSAGEDLSGTVDGDGGIEPVLESFHDLTRAALSTKVPTVAAINGIAVGGASELTLCFDTRLGTPRTEWLMPENELGLTISNAASHLLVRLLRGGGAVRLVLDGERLDADTAHRVGLLDEIVPHEQLLEAAVARILRWTGNGSATAAHLALLRPDPDLIEAAMRRETAAGLKVWDSGATRDGIARFWAGRGTAEIGS